MLRVATKPYKNIYTVGTTVLLLMLLAPRVASAHIGVLPLIVPAATLQMFTIRVPSERDIPTTSVRIEFPIEIIVSRFEPVAGWVRATEKDGAGRTIAASWSGGTIMGDEFQDFVFLARTPRQPGTLVFSSYQTYQDGETVAWNGAPDAERPGAFVEVVATETPLAGTELQIESVTAEANSTIAPTIVSSATAAIAEPTAVGTVPDAPTITEAATPTVVIATVEPAIPTAFPYADPTPIAAGGATTESGGSDLTLIVSLGALVIGLLALALAAVALARRPVAP